MVAKSEQALHQFRTLRAHKACHTQNFTLLQLESNMPEAFRIDGCKIFHLKYHFPGHILPDRIQFGKFTANHLGDNEISGQALRRPGSDILSVTHYRYFIADT